MKCKWCHNPESLDLESTQAFYSSKCKGCGKCVSVCQHNAIDNTFNFIRENCVKCGKCVEKCLYSAREILGYETTVENVLKEVMKDKIFYDRSGGGVTFSGGEPTFQFDFLLELCQKSKDFGLNVAIETNSFTQYEKLKILSQYIDTFLMDIKIIEDEKHIFWTGVSNKIILENIRKVSEELEKNILFRVPLIPKVNDTFKDLDLLSDFVKNLKNSHKVELMPYHDIGVSKYDACGMDYELRDIKPVDSITDAVEYLKSKGIDVI